MNEPVSQYELSSLDVTIIVLGLIELTRVYERKMDRPLTGRDPLQGKLNRILASRAKHADDLYNRLMDRRRQNREKSEP